MRGDRPDLSLDISSQIEILCPMTQLGTED